jgi:hypothetical protein
MLACDLHEFEMPRVQVAHRGDERDALAGPTQRGNLASQRRDCFDNNHVKEKFTGFTGLRRINKIRTKKLYALILSILKNPVNPVNSVL